MSKAPSNEFARSPHTLVPPEQNIAELRGQFVDSLRTHAEHVLIELRDEVLPPFATGDLAPHLAWLHKYHLEDEWLVMWAEKTLRMWSSSQHNAERLYLANPSAGTPDQPNPGVSGWLPPATTTLTVNLPAFDPRGDWKRAKAVHLAEFDRQLELHQSQSLKAAEKAGWRPLRQNRTVAVSPAPGDPLWADVKQEITPEMRYGWVVRFQVLGENVDEIALDRDSDNAFASASVGKAIARIARLIGLTLRT